MNNKNNYIKINRRTDIITVVIFLLLVFIPAVLFWIMPDKKSSEEENRSLQQMPEFSIDNLVSGKFTRNMGKYYADQFPFRNMLVGAKSLFSYAFFINENKGAIISKDGYLIQRFDLYSEKSISEKSSDELGGELTFYENMANIKNNCEYINKFSENILNIDNINITAAVTPRKIDVMTNKLPIFFSTERHEKYFDELNKYINQDIYLDLLEVLRLHNEEYIFFKTDHHWTIRGAYYAYIALGEKMGYESLSNIIKTASEDFYGTTWSKSGAKWINPDILEYYNAPDLNLYTTIIHDNASNKILNGFYDFEKLETKDKYSFFLGGINSRISIYSKTPREKLLLIADSFGQSLAPFLASHYDIEILDMRFFDNNIYDFIEENNIKNILIFPNMESLSTQNNLRKLISR